MDEKILLKYQRRIDDFLSSVSDNLVYRDYIPLTVEAAITPEPVPFADRLNLDYHPVHERESWGYDWASAWFHVTAEVPEEFAGKELCLRFHVGGEALVFDENGVPVYGLTGYSVFDELYCKERMVIGSGFKAHDKVEYYIECAANGLFGCPLPRPHDVTTPVATCGVGSRLLKHMRLCIFDRDTWGMLLDMRILNGILKSCGLKDYRGKRMLKILTDAMDLFNYDCSNAPKVRAMLKEKAFSAPAEYSALTAWSVGHGHLDVGWLWPVRESIRKAARTFSSQIVLMEKYPEYVFGASQAVLYEMIKENYPALYEKVRHYVQSGRWEVQGGMYVEADCNLTSGESLVRQFLHGKNFFRDEFGVEVKNLWLPDVFGYSANLPQIIRKSGCDYFLTQKLSWNEFNTFPHNTFNWVGVDGTSVLSHFPPENNYNAFGSSEQRIAAANRFAEAGVMDAFMSLYGIGDGGGGASEDFVENNLRQKNLEGCPKVVFGRADEFFEHIKDLSSELPSWHGELYFELHRGTMTSQARVKRGNRKCEQSLSALEFLYSALPVKEYPAAELDKIWKNVLLNQFHDILPGSSIHMVYETAEKDHARILQRSEELARAAAGKLFEASEKGAVLVNTLSCDVCEAVELPESWGTAQVCDAEGKMVASQLEDGKVVTLLPLPGNSFNNITQAPGKAVPVAPLNDLVLENKLIRYEFNNSGQLISAFDKERNCEIMQAPGNVLSLYHDRPLNNEAWDIEVYYQHDKAGEWHGKLQSGFTGPVRSSLKFVYNNGQSAMEQQIFLRPGSKRLDFCTRIDWQENRMMLRTSFPVNVAASEAVYDIQYAYLKRPVADNTIYDRARFECCGQRYADISDSLGGVALMNDCKYGYRIKDNVMDLALLRSPRHPDARADIGEHFFTYSFMPHSADHVGSGVIDEAAALNRQPCCFDGFQTGAAQPLCRQIAGKGISLEITKKAERADSWIVRVVETAGKHSSGTLFWRDDNISIHETDLIEWADLGSVELNGKQQQITLKPFEIKTYMVSYGSKDK
ncbi:MAG: alpha-mannosidase [Lentisphaerae bacterium]|nr:alpha-mannosidase [Lentisphaerota bacterium]